MSKNICFKLALGFVSVAAALVALEARKKKRDVREAAAVEAATAPYKDNFPAAETQPEVKLDQKVEEQSELTQKLGDALEQELKDLLGKEGITVKVSVAVVEPREDNAAE